MFPGLTASTLLTGDCERGAGSLGGGGRKFQCFPPSAVAIIAAWHADAQFTPPRTAPSIGDAKLAAAGRKPAAILAQAVPLDSTVPLEQDVTTAVLAGLASVT